METTPTTPRSSTNHTPNPGRSAMEQLETENPAENTPSLSRTVAIILSITCITGISNLLAGLLTVCIPVIANDLHIAPGLQLWPASAFALACGCTLLVCATIADVVGCRRTCLLGALLQAGSSLGAGLSRTPTQLVALRAFAALPHLCACPALRGSYHGRFQATADQEAGLLLLLPWAAVKPLVLVSLGLALGGIFSDTVGWRWGFHATSILNIVVLFIALWSLPSSIDKDAPLSQSTITRLRRDLDWIGALIISTSLACLSYVLAAVTHSDASRQMLEPANLSLLFAGLLLLPVYVFWMHRQTALGRPALIPNELWRNKAFTSVCVTVFLVWGGLNASEQLASLYLQDVRGFSALTSSLYFLPAPVCGVLTSVAVALVMPYLRVSLAVPLACFVSGLAPLLLAVLCRVDGPSYWQAMFQAMALNPIGADLMYTIAMLVVTNAFPLETQALAGGVFNMLAQIGKSVGIATTAIIAQQVTTPLMKDVEMREALLRGYHAGWWYNCGISFVSVGVGFWGLRSVGRLGIKRD
ncbi:integral membrane protein [Colletotrichum plurivorum]|uniref:Integral membrane protein n=1 Tax=Colletotrichum plurivorum TaxID=2175906 RepID=A0A8H6MUK5_9PEZI|nr:integral membrane protein [Colletotrichum plurivorum]